MSKQTIILDFDGVIHSYGSGWQGSPDIINDPPVPNVNEAIQELRKDYRVVVLSSRCHQKGGIPAIKKYLKKHDIEVDDVTWDEDMIDKIRNFKPWTKRKKEHTTV